MSEEDKQSLRNVIADCEEMFTLTRAIAKRNGPDDSTDALRIQGMAWELKTRAEKSLSENPKP